MHFDYCTTASMDFVMLEAASFSHIIQVSSFHGLVWTPSVIMKGSICNCKIDILPLGYLVFSSKLTGNAI